MSKYRYNKCKQINVHQKPDLISPRADFRLIQVINEDGHGLPDRRPVGAPHPLIHRHLDCLLEDLRRGGGREVALLKEALLRVVSACKGIEDARLGGALFSS